MTRRVNRGKPAFATATALTLLAFVGVLLASMATWVTIDARRTREAAAEAQLRQLLLAGAAAASDELAQTGAANVPLPSNLADNAARLTIDIAVPSESQRTATVEASVAARHARQVVQFSRRDGRWHLISATFDPP